MANVNVIVVGRRTIGLPLISTLQTFGHDVLCSLTRKDLYEERPGGSTRIKSIDLANLTLEKIANVLDPYCKRDEAEKPGPKAEVMFLAIPSRGKGEEEMLYIQYAHSRGMYVITFAKAAFAYQYGKIFPCRGQIGANAVVGGRTLILPWLRAHNFRGKPITLHGIVNTSLNKFFTETSKGTSIAEAFRTVKAAGLAEPGATDPVSFTNGEIHDKILKSAAMFNEGIAPLAGPYVTPKHLGEPVPVTIATLRELTSLRRKVRMIVRITNTLGQRLDFELGSPGSLCKEFGGYEFSLGFYDVSGTDAISEWANAYDDSYNSVRVQDDRGGEGSLITAGIGAGPGPTIGAAMCDLEEFLRNRARTPERVHVPSFLPQRGSQVGGLSGKR